MKYKKLTLSLIIMMILSLGGVAATLTYAKLSSSNTTQTMSGGTPPSMPGNSQSNSSDNTTQNQTDSSNKNMMISSTQSSGLGLMQALIIGECLFVFSASSLVFIATKAGKKSIKEALNKSYKVVIVVISTVLLTGALTYGTVMCANTYLLDSKQVQLQGSGTPPTLPSQSQ
jgi:flagellar basal body-associated protein FliL